MSAAQTQPRPPLLQKGMALFHDFDGSLVALAERPGAVVVGADLRTLLLALASHLDGAFALVSGRQLADLDRHFGGCRFAGAGVHGAELRRLAGGVIDVVQSAHVLGLVQALQCHFADDPRILVEDKRQSVALHYRLAPQREAECTEIMERLALSEGFKVQPGKMVLEALPKGIDKGLALHALMASAPFAGRVPVFVGDDATDEHGMAAAQMLGGFGIKVGSGASVAQYRLHSVAHVHGWLAAALPAAMRQATHSPAGAC